MKFSIFYSLLAAAITANAIYYAHSSQIQQHPQWNLCGEGGGTGGDLIELLSKVVFRVCIGIVGGFRRRSGLGSGTSSRPRRRVGF